MNPLPLLVLVFALGADVVIKRDGGKVTGTLVVDPNDPAHVIIRTRFGTIRFPRSEVRDILTTADPVEDYPSASKRFPDTAAGHFDLAMWCRQNGYAKEYRQELERVLSLDPDHAEAHRRLGHQKEGDRWLTRAEKLKARGLIVDHGRVVLPQEKQQAEIVKADRATQQEYYRRIRAWRQSLREGKRDRREASRQALLEIDDPLAVKPLVDCLGEKGWETERRLLVEILAKIDDPQATIGLVRVALEDPVATNRQSAAAALVERKTPELVRTIASYLGSNDNALVNRSADVLAAVGDSSVVPALIGALVTRHKYYRPPTAAELAQPNYFFPAGNPAPAGPGVATHAGNAIAGAPGQQSTVGPPSMAGFGVGTPPERILVVEDFRNESVHAALAKLTGEDFGFDKARWLAWMRHRANKTP